MEEQEKEEDDKSSTEGMSMVQKFQYKRAKHLAAKKAEEIRKKEMKKRDIEQLKVKFEEFSHCIV